MSPAHGLYHIEVTMLCMEAMRATCHSWTSTAVLGIQERTLLTDLQLTFSVTAVPSTASTSSLLLLLPHFHLRPTWMLISGCQPASLPLQQRLDPLGTLPSSYRRVALLFNNKLSLLSSYSEFGESAGAVASLKVFPSMWKGMWVHKIPLVPD